MTKQILVLGLSFLAIEAVSAQPNRYPASHQWIDFSGAIGQREGTVAFSYVYNRGVGKNRKLDLGLGLRLTSYSGHDKEFYTAPGKYARSTTFPFAIVFSDHLEKNLDTLTLTNAFTNALNVSLNAGYHLGRNWYLGSNIDLIGLTIGSKTNGVLKTNGKEEAEPVAKPTGFNFLLTGDNDIGSLNSEFFVRYSLSAHWDLKAVYQFAFSEYKTETIHQTAPDGNPVYRFRNKANVFGAGVAYNW